MKLQDPGLEALLEAYRADRRPPPAIRRAMWQRFEQRRAPRAGRWPRALVVTAMAVAALALLWLAARGWPGEVAEHRGDRSGTQSPFEREPARGGRAAPHAGGGSMTRPAHTAEGVVEPGTAAATEREATSEAPEDANVEARPATPEPPTAARGRGPAPQPPTSPMPAPAEPPGDSKSDELALIEAAEAALRANEPTRALTLLRRHEERFGRAATAQEREALRVLALCAAGREVEGRGARWAFLRAHPRSAYRERVEKACPAP